MEIPRINQPESLVNDPRHGCAFCGKSICITQTHCDDTCLNNEQILKSLEPDETVWETAFNPNI